MATVGSALPAAYMEPSPCRSQLLYHSTYRFSTSALTASDGTEENSVVRVFQHASRPRISRIRRPSASARSTASAFVVAKSIGCCRSVSVAGSESPDRIVAVPVRSAPVPFAAIVHAKASPFPPAAVSGDSRSEHSTSRQSPEESTPTSTRPPERGTNRTG